MSLTVCACRVHLLARVCKLTQLSQLSLGRGITGPIPDCLAKMAVQDINLAGGSLTLKDLDALFSPPDLYLLNVSSCGLAGQLPSTLALKGVEYLDMSNNALTGQLPTALNFSVLSSFNVANNKLVGPLPPTLTTSTNLYRINVSHNSFTGDLEWMRTTAPALQFEDLRSNCFTPSQGVISWCADWYGRCHVEPQLSPVQCQSSRKPS